MSINIKDYFECESISDYTGEDIIRLYCVKSKANKYDISVEFFGAVTEDGEILIESSYEAYITVEEYRYDKQSYLQQIADKVSDAKWAFGRPLVSPISGAIIEDMSYEDSISLDSTEDIIRQVIEAIIELDEVKE